MHTIEQLVAPYGLRRCPVSAFVVITFLRRDLYSNKLVTVSEGLFDGLTKLEFL